MSSPQTAAATCVLLALVCWLGAGCSQLPNPPSPSPVPAGSSQPARTVTVATLNLYHDREPWAPRSALVVEALRALDADVVALQEVIQRPTLRNQAEEIGAALGYQVHFVSNDPVDGAVRYGNALLSRHPILAQGSERLEPLADSRTVAYLRIDLHGTPVDVFATHLHAGEQGGATRTRQAEHLLEYVHATAGEHATVVIGDFNADVDSPELASLAGTFVDAYGSLEPGVRSDRSAHTTLNLAFFKTPARIDHVYAQRGRFLVESASLFANRRAEDGTWPSDHFGVVARLRLVPPSATR